MALIDEAFLRAKWGTERVTRDVANGGSVAAALASAEATALSHIQQRYGPGFAPDPVPLALKDAVANEAIYQLELKHPLIADEVKRAHEDAMAFFSRVARGLADLGQAGAPAVDDSTQHILMTKTAADSVFGSGKLDAWLGDGGRGGRRGF